MGEAGHGPATNGTEIVFEQNNGIVSNLRGVLLPGTARDPDISTTGEVVYLAEDGDGDWQIFSTTRGQLTFLPSGAQHPAVNSHGEVVYTTEGQVFSTVRGQLTALDGVFNSGPANTTIDDSGRVVFEAHGPADQQNLWEITPGGSVRQITFFEHPTRAGQATLAAVTGELVYIVVEDCDVTLVSDRDGVLLTGGNVCGPDRFSFPDLGAHGELVTLDHGVDEVVMPTVVTREGAADPCGVPGFDCGLDQCDLDGSGKTDLTDSAILRRVLAGESLP